MNWVEAQQLQLSYQKYKGVTMYFNLSTTIVDRTDLTIEEKMASVVMARYANNKAFEGLISLEIIAKKMGVSVAMAETALNGLKEKGLISSEEDILPKVQDNESKEVVSNVLKNDQKAKPVIFQPINKGDAKSDNGKTSYDEETIDKIRNIFEEVVPKNRVKILIGLAGGDVDRLTNAYYTVKKTHKYDVIDALADYLQQPAASSSESIKSAQQDVEEYLELSDDEVSELLNSLETPPSPAVTEKNINQQINIKRIQNLYKINDMKR